MKSFLLFIIIFGSILLFMKISGVLIRLIRLAFFWILVGIGLVTYHLLFCPALWLANHVAPSSDLREKEMEIPDRIRQRIGRYKEN